MRGARNARELTESITASDYAALVTTANSSRSKYKSRKTVVSGITFDSAKEAARYSELRVLEKAGVISDLKTQERFDLVVNGHRIGFYRADFTYLEMGEIVPEDARLVVEDVKSEMTRKLPVYRLKKRLMLALYGIDIRET